MGGVKSNPVTIIVPVYGDWESLGKNIRALKKRISIFSKHCVLFVNDCGPEADKIEKKILNLIKYRHNFMYYRNQKNIGFVRNCNNAVYDISKSNTDILLLNSDAIVTRGFLKNMQRVMYAKDDIGAVCPRSNAATIFSVPMKPDIDKQYSMNESYSIYKKIKSSLPDYYISPIAHGFCMMIRREVINKYGLFDEVYGMGYGEENDFCMRIRREGWKCAVANKAYVFHYKARSFSEERRSILVQSNEKILEERYPEYRGLINEYVGSISEPF